jgi:hypothetical protein
MINHFEIKLFYNIEKVMKCKYEKWRSKMDITIFIFLVFNVYLKLYKYFKLQIENQIENFY